MTDLIDDRLDTAEPFDPHQWIMHGILSAYFEPPEQRTRREDAILARTCGPCGTGVPAGDPARIRARAQAMGHILLRWPLRLTGLAAAILLIACLTWLATGRRQPLIKHIIPPVAAPAEACFIADGGITDPVVIMTTEERIRENRHERDQIVALGADEVCRQVPKLQALWNQIIRDLRNLGRFEQALSEAEAALRCSRECQSWDWEFVLLEDIGNIHAHQGQFDAAREAFLASIKARNELSGDPDEPTERGRAAKAEEYQRNGPLYRLMACVGISVGDFDEARRWQTRNEQALSYALSSLCERQQATFGAHASLTQCWHLAFDHERAKINADIDSDGPWSGQIDDPVSLASRLREHLLTEARLRRLAGDLYGAAQAMSDAESLPYSPRMDESRFDFNGPMEWARIAIARHNYAAALAAVEQASPNTGWVHVFKEGRDPDPVAVNKPPIGPLARAELDLLHGVALVGLHRDEAEVSQGNALVEQPLAVPRKMAESLPPDAREPFLRQFGAWKALIEAVGR